MYETRPVTSTKFSLLLFLRVLQSFGNSYRFVFSGYPCETNVESDIFVDVSRIGENSRKIPVTKLLETW